VLTVLTTGVVDTETTGVAVTWLVVETGGWVLTVGLLATGPGDWIGVGISPAELRTLSSPSVIPVAGSWIGVAPCCSQVLIWAIVGSVPNRDW